MKQTIRKTITVLLALVMVLTLLPTVTVTARADGVDLTLDPIDTATGNPITINSAEHGAVNASVSSAESGTTVTLTATPDSGYRLKSISGTYQIEPVETLHSNTSAVVKGSYFTVTPTYGSSAGWNLKKAGSNGSSNSITITSNDSEIKIDKAEFTKKSAGQYFSVSYLTIDNGSVSYSGGRLSITSVDANSFTVTGTGDNTQGYITNSVTIYGTATNKALTITSTDDENVKTFEMPGSGVVITAEFEEVPASTTTPVTYLDAQVDDTTHAVTYTPATCTDYTPVASDTDAVTWGEEGETTWYVVKEDATIANGVTFSGDVRLILCDGATLTVNSGTEDGNAIMNSGSGSLTVYAQSTGENAGALKATAQNGSAILADGCAVTINGGKVTATMGSDSGNGYAGIDVKNGSLTINGGVVNASVTGLYIGIRAEKAPVTINGGSVTAEGNMAGINLNETDLTMNGGSLAANSGMLCGISGSNASLAITGGTVTTESGFTGIYVDTVSISGGDLTIKNGINVNYDVSISGGDLTIKKGISGNNVSISGGSVKIDSADSAAIFANETVTISGGTVEATGKTYGIMTWNGDVTFTGGNVIASATDAGDASAVHSENGAVVIGPGLRVDAGDDESAPVKVTKTFPETHPQKWARIYEITKSEYTLTIPAAVTVSGAGWNATGSVSASGELAKGKKLTVTAASGDAFALVCQGKGQIGYYLAATATDTQPTTTWTFTALDDAPTTQPMGIIVSETDYRSARPGTYTDTVTFTAQVEDAPALQKMTIVAGLSNFETTADVDFYYMAGETWKQAIDNHPTENTGWSTFDYSAYYGIKVVRYNDENRNISYFRLYDNNKALVDFDLEIDPTPGKYTLANLST